MSKTPQPNRTPAEAKKAFDSALKRLLSSPPNPHKAEKKPKAPKAS